MEDINEEKINQEENVTPQEETCACEGRVEESNPTCECEAPKSCGCDNEEKPKCKCCKGVLWIIIGVVVGIMALVAVLFFTGKFSKYPGFKKDRDTGLYYQFYGDIHDTAAVPQRGDLVGILFSLKAGDSLLIPMMPNEMIMDSLYEGDFYTALGMMHVGDSATFIFNGNEFFQYFFQGQEYPFGEDPLYADIKLYGHITKEVFQQMQAEYEQQVREKQSQEDTLIQAYLAEHPNLKKTEDGIYMAVTQKGTGAIAEPMQNLKVHYTGRLLDGTVFDSSVERGEPFTFTLGAGQVIPGWEIALSKMHVGEKATVLIPSGLAYGERGNYAIPPFSPLVFDIEFIGVDTEVK